MWGSVASMAVGLGSLAAGDGAQMVQGWHYSSRAEKLSKLAYELDFQGFRLDVLGTIREEIRDQVFLIVSSLDNLMVVATLMMSIGFGFVVEGTFPPAKSEELGNWDMIIVSVDPLAVYSFLCAFSLICPFWCLIFTIRMRYEVETIVSEHMSALRGQLCNVLDRKDLKPPMADITCMVCGNVFMQDSNFCRKCGRRRHPDQDVDAMSPRDSEDGGGVVDPLAPRHDEIQKRVQRSTSASLAAGVEPLKSFRNSLPAFMTKVCPARIRRIGDQVTDVGELQKPFTEVARKLGPMSIGNHALDLQKDHILKWAQLDLVQRIDNYWAWVRLSHVLLWLGLLSSTFTCAILLGVFMMETFPDTPMMWRAYTYPVGLSGVGAVVFSLWTWMYGTGPGPKGREKPIAPGCLFPDTDRLYRQCSAPSRKESHDAATGKSPFERGVSLTKPLIDRRPASQNMSGIHVKDNGKYHGPRGETFCEIRVRDANIGSNSYKRVLLPVDNETGNLPSLEKTKKLVCKKFMETTKGALRGAYSSIEEVVRETDRLEICGDDDMAVIRRFDKLEVTFVFNLDATRFSSEGTNMSRQTSLDSQSRLQRGRSQTPPRAQR